MLLPLIEQFRALIGDRRADSRVLPKSAIGVAVRYALNRWKALVVFLADGGWRSTTTTPNESFAMQRSDPSAVFYRPLPSRYARTTIHLLSENPFFT